MGDTALIGFLIMFVVAILLTRLLGAWMLRINDVIRTQKENVEIQKEILKTLKEIRLEAKIQVLEIRNQKKSL